MTGEPSCTLLRSAGATTLLICSLLEVRSCPLLTTATSYVGVDGGYFTVVKDWTNVTRGGQVEASAGDEVEFTIAVTNVGAMTITTLTVTDTLPAGLVYKDGSRVASPSVGWATAYAAGTAWAGQSG